jgi:hypothetical protein
MWVKRSWCLKWLTYRNQLVFIFSVFTHTKKNVLRAAHVSFCQSMSDLLSAIKLCVRFRRNFVTCARFMKMCSMAVVLHFMAQMTFYPNSSYLPEWVRWSTGEHYLMPMSHCALRDNQCPDIHGVNNPLPLFSTILILFGCNSQQMSTTILWVAVSFVKICVLAVALNVAVQINLTI